MAVLITLASLATLSILACWGLARALRGQGHDAICLIPHDLRGSLGGAGADKEGGEGS